MHLTHDFPGTSLLSLWQRLRRDQTLPERLDLLRHRYGDIYWYHPSLRHDRVLVIYSLEAALGILQQESWIFNKALEPWHDRHRSRDAFERLVGDGLMLADGNHHRKHAALLVRNLADLGLWQKFEIQLRDCLSYYSPVDLRDSLTDFCSKLALQFLDIYYNLQIGTYDTESFFRCLSHAWSSKEQQLGCPFRYRIANSSRKRLKEIDVIKAQLRTLLDQQSLTSPADSQQASVQISNQSVVDEAIVMAISFVHKLPSFLLSAIQHVEKLAQDERQLLLAEWSISFTSLSTEVLKQDFPHTNAHLHAVISAVQPPHLLLKRVTVCDALIHGHVVPETTELWIPTWPPDLNLLFGLGSYSCKGEQFTLCIASRLMQWFCSLSS